MVEEAYRRFSLVPRLAHLASVPRRLDTTRFEVWVAIILQPCLANFREVVVHTLQFFVNCVVFHYPRNRIHGLLEVHKMNHG